MRDLRGKHFFMMPVLVLGILMLTGCTKERSETAQPMGTSLTVFKSPQCGCCGAWVEHIEKSGFTAKVRDTDKLSAIKAQWGIKPNYQSCHTAVSKEGYVFEGHVPASAIEKFNKEKPVDAVGLVVPGMPVGSPGMESGDKFQPYKVLLLKKDGSYETYVTINTMADQY